MIKNTPELKKFFQNEIRRLRISHKKAFRIYQALHNEAVDLGTIRSENILDGLDVDIRVARMIHRLKT